MDNINFKERLMSMKEEMGKVDREYTGVVNLVNKKVLETNAELVQKIIDVLEPFKLFDKKSIDFDLASCNIRNIELFEPHLIVVFKPNNVYTETGIYIRATFPPCSRSKLDSKFFSDHYEDNYIYENILNDFYSYLTTKYIPEFIKDTENDINEKKKFIKEHIERLNLSKKEIEENIPKCLLGVEYKSEN